MTQENKMEQLSSIEKFILGIDSAESTSWEGEKRSLSHRIRDSLFERLVGMNKRAGIVDDNFLDYCNTVKSLLAVYNFGNLLTDEDFTKSKGDPIRITGEGADLVITKEDNDERIKTDKDLIIRGLARIIRHVTEGIGYDITPYLAADDCLEIFKQEGDGQTQIVPVTLSAATVMTTLVYFRRAMKRINLFTDEDFVGENAGLLDSVVSVLAEILTLFYNYANPTDESLEKFIGWGVTLDRNRSRAVTLNDTYIVVDAISRFADAFTQEGLKGDREFLEMIDDYVAKKQGTSSSFMTDQCVSAIYKTALSVYERTKGKYGKDVFYASSHIEDNAIVYDYTSTTYEQISSSNRSSALFNPLYVAMITMYGYNEKELVIRRFMDDAKRAQQVYEEFEEKAAEKGMMKLSDYALTLDSYRDPVKDAKTGETRMNDFQRDIKMLCESKERQSKNFGVGTWRIYYRAARVLQKYLETQCPERLMEFAEYRDYLNATKDAIDQVQVMYRKFDDAQRLGIVDTDYLMFSKLELDVEDIGISKLNKANIAANYLRPMLLSSKIMIVNALTKYPQADMRDLYTSLKNKRHIKVTKRKGMVDKGIEWLWNEDNVDMNSTARHCEAIAYDYFDYYDKYEVGYVAIRNLKKELDAIKFGEKIDDEDGSLKAGAEDGESGVSSLKRLVLEFTRQNVDVIKSVYQQKIAAKNNAIGEKNNRIDELQEEKEKLRRDHEAEIEALNAKHAAALSAQADMTRISREMGDQIRGWVREETERYLKRFASLSLLNILWRNQSDKDFRFDVLYDRDPVDADFEDVREVWDEIRADCGEKGSSQYAENRDKYEREIKDAVALQEILSAALCGILEDELFRNMARDRQKSVAERNSDIKTMYNDRKRTGANDAIVRLGDKIGKLEERLPDVGMLEDLEKRIEQLEAKLKQKD